MKKIKLTLHKDTTWMLGEILNNIHQLPTGGLPSALLLEVLLCQEFFRANMAKLMFPLPDLVSRNQNKFTMQPSTALAIMTSLSGYDMADWQDYYRVLRDDLVSEIARQVGHLMQNSLTSKN